MKCILLTLGLALVCGIYAMDIPQSKKDLDIWKLAGIWHSMAMAASDLPLLETENAPLRLYIKEMRPSAEDKVEVVLLKRRFLVPSAQPKGFQLNRLTARTLLRRVRAGGARTTPNTWLSRDKGACVEVTVVAQKTEDPAVFTVNYQGERKVTVLDTDYERYLFFCMETDAETDSPADTEESGMVCQYLARTLKANTAVMEKFDGALKALPMHTQIFLDVTQGKVHGDSSLWAQTDPASHQGPAGSWGLSW
ncbi:beta-lactoglobulin-2-like [Dugong dugon]